MSIRKIKPLIILALLILLLVIVAVIAADKLFKVSDRPDGFPDQGFIHPHITGDIDSHHYHITPCLYPGQQRNNNTLTRYQPDNGKDYEVINTQSPAIDPCQHTGEHQLSDNHYQEWRVDNAIEHSWVLSYNFEPAYLNGLSLPNQSLPVYPTEQMAGQAFGFSLSSNDTGGQTATLAVDASVNVQGHYGLPFLGLGVFSSRNNRQQPLTTLAKTEKRQKDSLLQFSTALSSVMTYRIEAENHKDSDNIASHIKAYSGVQLFLFANWAGENRMISIALDYGDGMAATDSGGFVTKKWNWPIQGSYYAPGGELAYISAASLKKQCGFSDNSLPPPTIFTPSQPIKLKPEKNYRINIAAVYRCADAAGAFSENMPKSVPLTGVLWAVEAAASSQPNLHGEQLIVKLKEMSLGNLAE